MEKIEQVQSVWCELTGQTLNRRALERMFYEFVAIGFDDSDLRCVIKHMQNQNRRMTGASFCFRVHKVVGDLEWFASMIGEARAAERNRRVITPKEQVLQSFNPVVGEVAPNNVVSFKEALKKAVVNL